MIRSYRGALPSIHPSVFLAPGSEVIGNVSIGMDSSIWFNTVVRGDIHSIAIGERTNVQDGCVLHVTRDRYGLTVGSGVTVGHGVILHACTVGDECLIGMGTIVLDGAVIGRNSLIAAGSLVKMHDVVPEGVLAAGSPAKVVRTLTPGEIASIRQTALDYVSYARSYGPG